MVCGTRQTVVMQNDRDFVEVILLYLNLCTTILSESYPTLNYESTRSKHRIFVSRW
jgi:hypothetical protein